MSDIYKNMAKNLRSLCMSKCSSIADACDQMGINRQQFARYLNGRSFPRPVTLQKICRFFSVREIDLLSDFDEQADELRQKSQNFLQNKNVLSILAQIEDFSIPTIADGVYMTYFHTPMVPSFVLRAVTIIEAQGGQKFFRRLTGYGESHRSPFGLSLGNHRGIIIENKAELYFLALDKLRSQSPTMLALKWAPTKKPILNGTGIIRTPKGSEICSVVMESMPQGATWKDAVAESFAIGINEDQLRAHIRNVLRGS